MILMSAAPPNIIEYYRLYPISYAISLQPKNILKLVQYFALNIGRQLELLYIIK